MLEHHRKLLMKYYGKENSTFKGDEPTWANACVGENGNPQIFEYASGFASAANVLLDAVIENQGIDFCVDVFIYPICFNMRHAVELFLKACIKDLTHIANKRRSQLPKFDLVNSHNLGDIWKHVKAVALITDQRYEPMLAALNEYVVDIATVDATGQVFRYPFDTNNQKHLTNIAVINTVVLKSRFMVLEERLRQLNFLNERLLEEYAWGSFTTHLSRIQLQELTSKLPVRDKWKESNFADKKASLQAEYGLSSREFCRALTIIQSRHEMASQIGITVEIPEIDFQGLQTFIDVWSKMNDIEQVKNPLPVSFDVIDFDKDFMSGIYESHVIEQQCSDELTNTMKPECFAALRALFYFHREAPYSEVFDLLLKNYRKESANHLAYPEIYKKDALHVLRKTNALENILNSLNSLNFLGQTTLLNSAIENYDLETCKSQILKFSETRKMHLKEFSMA